MFDTNDDQQVVPNAPMEALSADLWKKFATARSSGSDLVVLKWRNT